MNEVEELENAVKKYSRMVELFDSDTFKEFEKDIMDIGEELGLKLVFNYNGLKAERKEAIINQMNFISGFRNYVDGMRTMKEHVEMEMDAYLESIKDEE